MEKECRYGGSENIKNRSGSGCGVNKDNSKIEFSNKNNGCSGANSSSGVNSSGGANGSGGANSSDGANSSGGASLLLAGAGSALKATTATSSSSGLSGVASGAGEDEDETIALKGAKGGDGRDQVHDGLLQHGARPQEDVHSNALLGREAV